MVEPSLHRDDSFDYLKATYPGFLFEAQKIRGPVQTSYLLSLVALQDTTVVWHQIQLSTADFWECSRTCYTSQRRKNSYLYVAFQIRQFFFFWGGGLLLVELYCVQHVRRFSRIPNSKV